MARIASSTPETRHRRDALSPEPWLPPPAPYPPTISSHHQPSLPVTSPDDRQHPTPSPLASVATPPPENRQTQEPQIEWVEPHLGKLFVCITDCWAVGPVAASFVRAASPTSTSWAEELRISDRPRPPIEATPRFYPACHCADRLGVQTAPSPAIFAAPAYLIRKSPAADGSPSFPPLLTVSKQKLDLGPVPLWRGPRAGFFFGGASLRLAAPIRIKQETFRSPTSNLNLPPPPTV